MPRWQHCELSSHIKQTALLGELGGLLGLYWGYIGGYIGMMEKNPKLSKQWKGEWKPSFL